MAFVVVSSKSYFQVVKQKFSFGVCVTRRSYYNLRNVSGLVTSPGFKLYLPLFRSNFMDLDLLFKNPISFSWSTGNLSSNVRSIFIV